MILTEDEIQEIQNHPFSQNDWLWFYTRAIEAAILKKIGEPVAWHHEVEGLSYENHYSGNVPLYELPEVKE